MAILSAVVFPICGNVSLSLEWIIKGASKTQKNLPGYFAVVIS